jgi:hypothetical protein
MNQNENIADNEAAGNTAGTDSTGSTRSQINDFGSFKSDAIDASGDTLKMQGGTSFGSIISNTASTIKNWDTLKDNG